MVIDNQEMLNQEATLKINTGEPASEVYRNMDLFISLI